MNRVAIPRLKFEGYLGHLCGGRRHRPFIHQFGETLTGKELGKLGAICSSLIPRKRNHRRGAMQGPRKLS